MESRIFHPDYWTGLGISMPWSALIALIFILVLMGLHMLKDAEDKKNIRNELKAQADAQLKQAFDQKVGGAKAIADIHAELAELRKLVELALRLPKN